MGVMGAAARTGRRAAHAAAVPGNAPSAPDVPRAEEDAARWLAANWTRLRAIVLQVVPAELLDDALQEGALRLWRRWDRFVPQQRAPAALARQRATWCFLTAQRAAIDLWRREALRARLPYADDADDAGVDVEARALAAVELPQVWPRLTPVEQRIAAGAAAGYGYGELEAVTGLTVGAIKSRVVRWRQRLARETPRHAAP